MCVQEGPLESLFRSRVCRSLILIIRDALFSGYAPPLFGKSHANVAKHGPAMPISGCLLFIAFACPTITAFSLFRTVNVRILIIAYTNKGDDSYKACSKLTRLSPMLWVIGQCALLCLAWYVVFLTLSKGRRNTKIIELLWESDDSL